MVKIDKIIEQIEAEGWVAFGMVCYSPQDDQMKFVYLSPDDREVTKAMFEKFGLRLITTGKRLKEGL